MDIQQVLRSSNLSLESLRTQLLGDSLHNQQYVAGYTGGRRAVPPPEAWRTQQLEDLYGDAPKRKPRRKPKRQARRHKQSQSLKDDDDAARWADKRPRRLRRRRRRPGVYS